MLFFFQNCLYVCGLSLEQTQGGTNQHFLLMRQGHTLYHPISTELQKPTSGVTSLRKQYCRLSDPPIWLISHYYCKAFPNDFTYKIWTRDVLTMWRMWRKRSKHEARSVRKNSIWPNVCSICCCASTWHPTTHAEQEFDFGHSNKSIVSTDPWGDQFALLWFQAFQQGWIEDKGPLAAAGGLAMFF